MSALQLREDFIRAWRSTEPDSLERVSLEMSVVDDPTLAELVDHLRAEPPPVLDRQQRVNLANAIAGVLEDHVGQAGDCALLGWRYGVADRVTAEVEAYLAARKGAAVPR